ncbi:endospore germination permease [Paenibacillus hodogayensis]|uniref:Endospore germination permease n=1 Tax=Paenibacillus hodogayensis TaxID=279208 RepID=A0ABV5VV40_9BACL
MQSSRKISVLQMYMVLMLSIGISNHVLLIPILLEAAKRDAWVGALASIVPVALWGFILYVVSRKTRQMAIADWLEKHYGKVTRRLLEAVIVIYLFVAAYVSLSDTVTWTNVSYLPRTPKLVIVLFFILLCCFAALAGMRAIAITAGLLLPAVVLLGDFVALANTQYKDYALLTPLFTHGYEPSLRALGYACCGLFELVLIVLMQHHVSSQIRFRGVMIMTLILVGLTTGPLTGSIALFGPFEAAEQRYPAFEQWRMVTLGKFISHLDFLSIYQWISGSFIRVSLMLFLIPDVTGIKSRKRRSYTLIGLSVVLLVLALLPFSDAKMLQFLSALYFPGIFVLNAGFGLLLFALTLLPAAKRRGKENAD